MLFAVVDIETTGGNFHKDRIIEIAVVVHDGYKTVQEYSSLINPEQSIIPFIVNLTGISNDMVKKAPTFPELAEEIFEIIKDKIFVAHNARFDYGFLKSEFRRSNIDFRSKQLCTVEMSRKIFPGMRSYSLGNLCSDLNISINGRHRAYGDAAATALLLGKMMIHDEKTLMDSIQEDEFQNLLLPSDISKDVIEYLPEETGVFYFHDADGKILFISKAKNIRQQVASHFKADQKDNRLKILAEKVSSITFELCGNELVAALKEVNELRKWSPAFNPAQRKPRYKYGLYIESDDEGYCIAKILPLQTDAKPLLRFSHQARAEKMLDQVLKRAKLTPQQKNIYPKNHYNQKIRQTLNSLTYAHENFLIVDQGRSGTEHSFIHISDGECRAFGFFDPQFTGNDVEMILSFKEKAEETPELKRQIQQYIKKKKKYLQTILLPTN